MARTPKSKTSLQRELHAAHKLLDEQSTKINSLTIAMEQRDSEFSRICQRLQRRDLEVSRLNGYIDRVREVEGRPTYEVGVATDGHINDADFDRG